MSIAFQGESGAFSELAAIEYFGGKQKAVAVPMWEDVFDAVEKRNADFGIIPIENSLGGSIHKNYDFLLQHDLCITGEIFLKISQFFLANKGVTLSKVRRIYSHPQGFEQCRDYIKKLKNVELIPVSNTATAAKMVKDSGAPDAATISSMQAAIDYDLHILARNIEDNAENITRFLILSKKPHVYARHGDMKTSVVFSLKNMAGALFKSLSVFALRDIDLIKIESRPVKGKPFEYMFYLDFAGSETAKSQSHALNHLQEITMFCRVLGSYPVGRLAHPEYKKR
jgi:prephenate dehydratase